MFKKIITLSLLSCSINAFAENALISDDVIAQCDENANIDEILFVGVLFANTPEDQLLKDYEGKELKYAKSKIEEIKAKTEKEKNKLKETMEQSLNLGSFKKVHEEVKNICIIDHLNNKKETDTKKINNCIKHSVTMSETLEDFFYKKLPLEDAILNVLGNKELNDSDKITQVEYRASIYKIANTNEEARKPFERLKETNLQAKISETKNTELIHCLN